ncbi:hypothetical protein NQ117_15355 [Paenibacillus sp. SC116]|uniref:hypothetical protein n=1 Tax=Paenibacillus sp. SC116 TaxID=2968986 RepID=UPI00215AEF04|nr:hypothetical protein [Paenibacillus sp. SC116]MCR8845059.1 hypothetical protein [Paenibacillus sp. SC116]
MKQNKYLLLALVPILISVGVNIYQWERLRISDKKSDYIDRDFTAAIGRISAGIEEGKPPGDIALEHAFKMSALLEYTSYDKRITAQYASVVPLKLRDMALNGQPIQGALHIKNLLHTLANDPENVQINNEIIKFFLQD